MNNEELIKRLEFLGQNNWPVYLYPRGNSTEVVLKYDDETRLVLVTQHREVAYSWSYAGLIIAWIKAVLADTDYLLYSTPTSKGTTTSLSTGRPKSFRKSYKLSNNGLFKRNRETELDALTATVVALVEHAGLQWKG